MTWMNMMHVPAHVWLLDKNVVRRAIEGIRSSLVAVPLTVEQSLAIRLFSLAKQLNALMMITPETANILSQRSHMLEVRLLLHEVGVMRRGRYFRRWARRLREHDFTREDAKILSYGTFGLDPTDLILGVSVVVTFDRPFINNFGTHRDLLNQRLNIMTAQLHAPYRNAKIPESAISRSYYAVYHHVLLWWKGNDRFPDYKDRGHAKIRMVLFNAAFPTVRDFSRNLKYIGDERRRADYELVHRFDLHDGQSILNLARNAITAFDAIDKSALADGVEDYLRKTSQI